MRFCIKCVSFIVSLVCFVSNSGNAAGDYNTVDVYGSLPFKNATELIKAKNFVAAEPILRSESIKDSNNPDVWNLLGYTSRKIGKYDQAEEAYRRALKLDPKHKKALEYMGEMYLTLGDLQKAKELLDKLKEICPNGCEELDMLEMRYLETKSN